VLIGGRLSAGLVDRLAARLNEQFAADWSVLAQASAGLRRYLRSRIPGLWHDLLTPDGHFVPGGSPASSFYHVVSAISALNVAP